MQALRCCQEKPWLVLSVGESKQGPLLSAGAEPQQEPLRVEGVRSTAGRGEPARVLGLGLGTCTCFHEHWGI